MTVKRDETHIASTSAAIEFTEDGGIVLLLPEGAIDTPDGMVQPMVQFAVAVWKHIQDEDNVTQIAKEYMADLEEKMGDDETGSDGTIH